MSVSAASRIRSCSAGVQLRGADVLERADDAAVCLGALAGHSSLIVRIRLGLTEPVTLRTPARSGRHTPMTHVPDLTANPRATASLDVLDPATGERGGPHPRRFAARPSTPPCAPPAPPSPPGRAPRPAERAGALKAAARRLRAERRGARRARRPREGGKPLADSLGGVEAGIGAIEQYAELGPLHRGRSLQGGWEAADLMVHEPRGVVALLVPWNDPIAIACGQIAAALVTGNTVVYKPSEKTPLSGARLVELLDLRRRAAARAGRRPRRPAARRAPARGPRHPHGLGARRAARCSRPAPTASARRCCELGGKDAMIIDAGVDPEWAAEQAALGAWANAGQVCTSVERIYVHRDVAEPFIDALARRAEALEIGDPRDPGTEMGPLIDEDQRDWVHNQVEDAVHNGAELRAGGRVPDGPGCFYPPTVLVGPPGDAPVIAQETFGPVAAVRIVDSFDGRARGGQPRRVRARRGGPHAVARARAARLARARRRHGQGQRRRSAARRAARPSRAASPATASATGPSCSTRSRRTKVVHLARRAAGGRSGLRLRVSLIGQFRMVGSGAARARVHGHDLPAAHSPDRGAAGPPHPPRRTTTAAGCAPAPTA